MAEENPFTIKPDHCPIRKVITRGEWMIRLECGHAQAYSPTTAEFLETTCASCELKDWTAAKKPRKPRPRESAAARRFAHVDEGLFQREIERLKSKNYDVQELLDYRASLGPNPEPLPDDDGPSWKDMPTGMKQAGELLGEMKENGQRQGDGKPSSGTTVTKLSDLGISPDQSSKWQQPIPQERTRGAVSIPALIEALKEAGLPPEKILEVLSKCT